MYRTLLSAVAATALLGTALAGAPVQAEDPARPATTVLAKGLLSPLSLAVTRGGGIYYAESFKGALLTKAPGRRPRVVFQAGRGVEVGAVSEQRGAVRFATTLPEGRGAFLKALGTKGRARTVADLGRFETRRNPDRRVRYGLRTVPAGCSVPQGYPFRYRGVVEAHPYATEISGRTTYVADAAGNTVLRVGPRGRVSTVAVLPPVPVEVTPAMATALELPECTVGAVYHLEPVPTDVELGPDGRLYVSSLPGGPEDGSTGPVAGVFRVDPRTGRTVKVARGLVSATGVDVAPNGDLYVAELFRDRVAKVRRGTRRVTTFASAPMVGDVELRRGVVYATTHVLTGLSGEPGDVPSGQVVRIRR
ncbi:ScyD/ScyE family protein [Nocardioides sp. 503]|uniref:ScyD/ScyE family protein n=1 Tax=Nocardioides sp. 503 TaxID=2508326 RepID=UPI00106FB36D|nr:ScyD/ScyE family protein [Nocardioides sp. 503]